MQPLELAGLSRIRRRALSRAVGCVLEVGAGSGLNAPYYDFRRVDTLHVTDRLADTRALRRAFHRAGAPPDRMSFGDADLCELPYADASFDSIVCTLVLCSVASTAGAIREMHRVLKPDGTVCFIEHVHSSHPVLRPVLDAATPAWRRVAGGCRLNRNSVSAFRQHGFSVQVEHTAVDGVLRSGYAIRT